MTLSTTLSPPALDELSINTPVSWPWIWCRKRIRDIRVCPWARRPHAYTALGSLLLKVNPGDPGWPDRDRFVLSAGHGSRSPLQLYMSQALTFPTAQLQPLPPVGRVRHQATPNTVKTRPAWKRPPGPWGRASPMPSAWPSPRPRSRPASNRPDHVVVDHDTYVLVSDGDMMEGVASEAASLAGHLRLGKLIALYADNHVSLSGSTDLIFTEDRLARFAAYGWHTQQVADGNDIDAVASALKTARAEADRPSLIAVRTHIGYGSPNKHDSSAAHGEPLGVDEVRLTKQILGWPVESAFYVPPESLDHFRAFAERGAARQADWTSRFQAYAKKYPELAAEYRRIMLRGLPVGWDRELPSFRTADGPLATRVASGKVINALAARLPELMGGDADLAPSTHTLIEDSDNFEPSSRAGRNLRFGVREHAMGAILNGMALHRGFIPYGATFLIFSDYMRPPMRLAAMNGLPVIYVFTHDSIAMGEDGPTHQPIEQLLGLRSVPGLTVIRPADANETTAAWRIAIESTDRPTALVLTRQKLGVLDLATYPEIPAGVPRGGYILADAADGDEPDVVLIATGSEVHLALNARDRLAIDGVKARVVSLPCWSIFKAQDETYRTQVLPAGVPQLALEAGATLGWDSYLDPPKAVLGIDCFGASAPGDVVMREYGFTVENVCQQVGDLLQQRKVAAGPQHEKNVKSARSP